MTFAMAVIFVLIWTVLREELLDRYWRYTENGHLYQFGNLYVILGCIVLSILVSIIGF